MEKLTGIEKNNLKNIMNTSYSLLEKYMTLRDLENDGFLGSPKFNDNSSSLQQLITLEEYLYSEIDINRMDLYLNELNVVENLWDLRRDIEPSKTETFDNLVKRRVVCRLLDMKYGNIHNALTYGNLSYEIKKDVIRTILTILNLYLNDYTFEPIQKQLLIFKYNLGFIFKFIESDFINNNFAINPELYWTTYLVTDAYQMPREDVDDYRYAFAADILDNEFDFVLEQNSRSLCNIGNYARAIISQILIRTSLLFSPDNLSADLADQFEKNINVNLMNNGDSTAEYFVMEAIEVLDYDKEIPKIVSLGM